MPVENSIEVCTTALLDIVFLLDKQNRILEAILDNSIISFEEVK